MSFETALSAVLAIEGGYTNDPADRGGETNFGITLATARAHGYDGPMKTMRREDAATIYRQVYWDDVGLDHVSALDEQTAEILFDIAVNMGVRTAGSFLQRALNLLNRNALLFADLQINGNIGDAVLAALGKLAPPDVSVLRRLIRAYQAKRYIDIIENDPTQERFTRGWIKRLGG